jgi:hypothetical protein
MLGKYRVAIQMTASRVVLHSTELVIQYHQNIYIHVEEQTKTMTIPKEFLTADIGSACFLRMSSAHVVD